MRRRIFVLVYCAVAKVPEVHERIVIGVKRQFCGDVYGKRRFASRRTALNGNLRDWRLIHDLILYATRGMGENFPIVFCVGVDVTDSADARQRRYRDAVVATF